jgi:hypothetical protein
MSRVRLLGLALRAVAVLVAAYVRLRLGIRRHRRALRRALADGGLPKAAAALLAEEHARRLRALLSLRKWMA